MFCQWPVSAGQLPDTSREPLGVNLADLRPETVNSLTFGSARKLQGFWRFLQLISRRTRISGRVDFLPTEPIARG